MYTVFKSSMEYDKIEQFKLYLNTHLKILYHMECKIQGEKGRNAEERGKEGGCFYH